MTWVHIETKILNYTLQNWIVKTIGSIQLPNDTAQRQIVYQVGAGSSVCNDELLFPSSVI
jgi:hypothetical protein